MSPSRTDRKYGQDSLAWVPQALLLRRSEGNVERSRAARQGFSTYKNLPFFLILHPITINDQIGMALE